MLIQISVTESPQRPNLFSSWLFYKKVEEFGLLNMLAGLSVEKISAEILRKFSFVLTWGNN